MNMTKLLFIISMLLNAPFVMGGKLLLLQIMNNQVISMATIHACPPLPSMLIKMDIFSPSNQVWLVRLLKSWQMTRSYIVLS